MSLLSLVPLFLFQSFSPFTVLRQQVFAFQGSSPSTVPGPSSSDGVQGNGNVGNSAFHSNGYYVPQGAGAGGKLGVNGVSAGASRYPAQPGGKVIGIGGLNGVGNGYR